MKAIETKAWVLLITGLLLFCFVVGMVYSAPKIMTFVNIVSGYLSGYRETIYNVAIAVMTTLWLKGQIKEYLLIQELKTLHRSG